MRVGLNSFSYYYRGVPWTYKSWLYFWMYFMFYYIINDKIFTKKHLSPLAYHVFTGRYNLRTDSAPKSLLSLQSWSSRLLENNTVVIFVFSDNSLLEIGNEWQFQKRNHNLPFRKLRSFFKIWPMRCRT